MKLAHIEIDGDLTRPYVLVSESVEVFRANTQAKCERHAAWKEYQVVEFDPAGDQGVCPNPSACAAASECLAGCGLVRAEQSKSERNQLVQCGRVAILLSLVLLTSPAIASRPKGCVPGTDCRPWCRVGQKPPSCRNGSGSGAKTKPVVQPPNYGAPSFGKYTRGTGTR
jgi:hypothetical protein